MTIYDDIKSAMRFLNNANQEVIARNNKFYNKKGECIAIVNLPKKNKVEKKVRTAFIKRRENEQKQYGQAVFYLERKN